MTQAKKWNGKSVYRLNLALNEASRYAAARHTTMQALRAAEEKAGLEAAEQVVELMGLEIPAKNLALGGWECENSPTERCIYDEVEDPWKDSCLVCGDPSERK